MRSQPQYLNCVKLQKRNVYINYICISLTYQPPQAVNLSVTHGQIHNPES